MNIIARYVYHWASKVMMGHDSYFCRVFPNSFPFPKEREDKIHNFAGAISIKYIEKQSQLPFTDEFVCPVPCRGKPDWTYC